MREKWLPVIAMAAIYALFMGWCSTGLHRHLSTGIFDLGIHVQTIWLAAHRLPEFLTTRGLPASADHFTPLLWLLAAAGLTQPLGLLWLQSVALASGAWPMYRLARLELGPTTRAPLGFALVYLLQPGLWGANLFEFHPTALAAPLLLWALWGLHGGRSGLYAGCLLLISTLGEALGVTICLLAFEAGRAGRRRVALATLAWGGATLGTAWWWMRQASGGAPSQYASLYHGFQAHELWGGVVYLGSMLLALGGLPLLGWQRTVPAWPVLLGNLLTWRSAQRALGHHYMAAILPFLLWAALAGWKRRPWGWPALPLLAGLTLFLHGGRLISTLAPAPDLQLLAAIPAVASVSADNHPGAWLAQRRQLYMFPNPMQPMCWGNRPQALVEQLNDGGHPLLPGALRRALDRRGPEWLVLQDGDHWPLHELDRRYWNRQIERNRAYRQVQRSGSLSLWRRQLPPGTPELLWREIHPRLSGDGRVLVYEAEDGVVRRDLTGGGRRVLGPGATPDVDSRGENVLFVSDSDRLTPGDDNVSADVFWWSESGLRRWSPGGETARVSAYFPRFEKTGPVFLGYGKRRLPRRWGESATAPSPSENPPRFLGPMAGDWGTVIGPDGELRCRSWSTGRELPGATPCQGGGELLTVRESQGVYAIWAGERRLVFAAGADSFEPALSRDGRWLAYTSYKGGVLGEGVASPRSAKGGVLGEGVASPRSAKGGVLGEGVASPRSTKGGVLGEGVASPSSLEAAPRSRIFLLDRHTGQETCLTPAPSQDCYHPAVADDGRRLAWVEGQKVYCWSPPDLVRECP